MKLLQLKPVYFKLSEDFQGTLPDALRQLADFLESDTPSLPKCTKDVASEPWEAFNEVVENGGRFAGQVGVEELVNGSWIKIKGSK